jgi:hypothetical protein
MNHFSPDFATAQARFREAAQQLGWALESHSIGSKGPAGEDLAIDVAVSGEPDGGSCLVISSGVHGVEGYFGSAVQLAALQAWLADPASRPRCRVVMIHAVNPYGMAWLRRFNEDNIDLNRNMLRDGEGYAGSPEGYDRLDRLINPPSPPTPWEPVLLKFAAAIVRSGRTALQQAVTSGQYEHPKGLFFGGSGASRSKAILDRHYVRWLGEARRVFHLDLHTGLGPSATYQMLVDHPLEPGQRARLDGAFGADCVRDMGPGSVSAALRGSFGLWGQWRAQPRDYVYAAAEFGTYSGQRVLAALRAENRCVHWGVHDSEQTRRAKRALLEAFCPAAPRWRQQVLDSGLRLVTQAQNALAAA